LECPALAGPILQKERNFDDDGDRAQVYEKSELQAELRRKPFMITWLMSARIQLFPLPLWERVREREVVSSFDTRSTSLDLW
jgi:hypothetical protein